MTYQNYTITLPDSVAARLSVAADAQGITVAAMIRNLALEADAPPTAPEMIEHLRLALSPALAMARDWDDLQARLIKRGFELRPDGAGLRLHSRFDGRAVCDSTELGYTYGQLVRRFCAPMPGHAKQMRRILKPKLERSGRSAGALALMETRARRFDAKRGATKKAARAQDADDLWNIFEPM
ncbi:MAG: hypothetical protein CR993_04895 [Rhodobacterales bacterium]|nr:MAG: hypothetical protein CR993_04895 [Rhodobacterales bacterium]